MENEKIGNNSAIEKKNLEAESFALWNRIERNRNAAKREQGVIDDLQTSGRQSEISEHLENIEKLNSEFRLLLEDYKKINEILKK